MLQEFFVEFWKEKICTTKFVCLVELLNTSEYSSHKAIVGPVPLQLYDQYRQELEKTEGLSGENLKMKDRHNKRKIWLLKKNWNESDLWLKDYIFMHVSLGLDKRTKIEFHWNLKTRITIDIVKEIENDKTS